MIFRPRARAAASDSRVGRRMAAGMPLCYRGGAECGKTSRVRRGGRATMLTMTQRVEAARGPLGTEGIDLLAIPPGDDLLYLLGYTPHLDERPCYLFVGREEVLFLVPDLNAAAAAPHVPFPTLTYSHAAVLPRQELWPEARFVPGAQVMAPLRMIKSAEEIATLRRAAATADAAVRAGFGACRPGMRETELARIAQEAFYAAGAQEVLIPIVAAGPNSAFPHHATSSRAVQAGEPVLADLGSRLDGYMSDITRMAFLDTPTARYREIHAVVEEAVAAALETIGPGVPIREVDLAARRVIERAGYGDRFTHRTGHGIGVSGHELPSIMHTNEQPLQVGMAFSVEPGIYLVGEFGGRLRGVGAVRGRRAG